MLPRLIVFLLACNQIPISGRSPEQVAEWLEESSWSVDAQYSLGIAYMEGDGAPLYKPEGFKWFKKAAEEEIDQSIRILTKIYNEHPEMLNDGK